MKNLTSLLPTHRAIHGYFICMKAIKLWTTPTKLEPMISSFSPIPKMMAISAWISLKIINLWAPWSDYHLKRLVILAMPACGKFRSNLYQKYLLSPIKNEEPKEPILFVTCLQENIWKYIPSKSRAWRKIWQILLYKTHD